MTKDPGSVFRDPEDRRLEPPGPPSVPPPLPPAPVPSRRRRFYGLPFGEAMGSCFKIWFRNFIPFTLLALLVYSPLLVGAFFFFRSDPGQDARFWFQNVIVLVVDNALLNFVLAAGVTFATVEQLRGARTPVGRCLAVGLGRIGVVFLAAILLFLVLLGGFILLIVPGIIFTYVFYVTIPVAVMERTDPVTSLKRSAFLTKGSRWTIFGLALVMGLILGFAGGVLIAVLLVASGVSPLGDPNEFGEISFWLGQFIGILIQPPAAIIPAVVYFYLRTGKEGVDVNELAAVFE